MEACHGTFNIPRERERDRFLVQTWVSMLGGICSDWADWF